MFFNNEIYFLYFSYRMLNTIPLKKNNIQPQHITDETILEEGIRKIEEKTNEPFEENVLPKHVGGNIFDFSIKEKMIKEQINDNILIKNEMGNFNLNIPINKEKQILDINDEKQLMVSINEDLSKITVCDEKGQPLGFITVHHIAKYLGDIYDTKQQFLTDLDKEVFNKSKTLIKKLIFKLNYNKKDKYADIMLLDHKKSGFMGDIELLIKLNNILDNYYKNRLQSDLAPVESHNKVKIEQNINKFTFLMINYSLGIISYISEMIKNDHSEQKNALKQQLLKYAIGLNYRLNLFVQTQLKFIHNQNKKIQESLDTNLKIKKVIMERLDSGIKNIKTEKQHSDKKHIQSSQQLFPSKKPKSLTPSMYYEEY